MNARSSTGKVLVVDDDRFALALTKRRLESRGYCVTVRDRALGTSKVISQERPDILLLDVNMPMLSGNQLAALLSSNKSFAVPFIFHSSEPPQKLNDLVRETGALGSIEKTDDAEAFLNAFDSLFSRSVGK